MKDFTLHTWIYPTLINSTITNIITKSDNNVGYKLFIDEKGCLSFFIGDHNSNNIVNLNDWNIWLKNKINNNILYINAEKINIKKMSLKDAMIIDYRDKNPKIYFAKEGLIKKRYISCN